MNKDMQKTEKIVRIILLVILAIYVVLVLWLTVFSRESSPDAVCYQGDLFWSVRGAIADPQGTLPLEILYNCLMLIPLGFILAWLLSPSITVDCGVGIQSEGKIFIITAAAGFLLTCTIEVLQLVWRRGLFEYDDIIYNTLGTVIGYFLYRLTRIILIRIFNSSSQAGQ